jgi:hypothetical protein
MHGRDAFSTVLSSLESFEKGRIVDRIVKECQDCTSLISWQCLFAVEGNPYLATSLQCRSHPPSLPARRGRGDVHTRAMGQRVSPKV